jgi:hypothetical protein
MTLKRSRPVLRGLVGSNAHLATRLTFAVQPPYARVTCEMTEESERMSCPSPAGESRRLGVS